MANNVASGTAAFVGKTAADRQRDYRRRVRGGRCCLLIEVDEVDCLEMLIRAGLLEPSLEHTRDQLAEALARQIDLLGRSRSEPVNPSERARPAQQ
jgi:hypothetical protein